MCVLWNRDYVIKGNRSRDTKNSFMKNSFVHITRQSDNPDGLAENLVTNIFKTMLHNLVPFEKTRFVTSATKECHVILVITFAKTIWSDTTDDNPLEF